ncbi:MAG: peroxide stress protein YaaA [Pseudomonadota bacterium]
MLCVISPAKSLDLAPAPPEIPRSAPAFQADAVRLARSAGRLSRARLKALMALSDDLATLNYERFKAFSDAPAEAATKQAALAFAGDTYAGLDFASLDAGSVAYAQGHLRILSGLYGLLRPMDAIQPYRLEMGRRLKTGRAESLYAYWGTRLAEGLDAAAEEAGARFLLNAASQEYFRAAREDALRTPVITPVFLDEKNGVAKTISFFAKRARGAMARFVLEHRIVDAADLAGFGWEGYRFRAEDSAPLRPVFQRSERMAA